MWQPTTFWRFLELRTDRIAVMHEWKSVAGEMLSMVRPLLVPLAERATGYPNPRPYGTLLNVIYHTDGSIVAIDEDDYQNRFELSEEDVVLYQLDLRKLRKTICTALSSIRIAKTPVDNNSYCIQVGSFQPKKAASFPVYLLLCPNRRILERELLSLLVSCKKPGTILLSPTARSWDDKLEELARSRKFLPVNLSEVIEPADGALCETDGWEEYLRAFCQMIKLTLPSNYSNKRPPPIRKTRASNIEKLQRELEEHIISARDHAHKLADSGLQPQLLPRPSKSALGRRLGLAPHDVSRCINDSRAGLLKILWHTAGCLEEVMRYKRR